MNKVFIEKFYNSSLIIDHIFISFNNLPLLFVCKDTFNHYYLCVFIGRWDHFEYIMARTDPCFLVRLVHKECSVYDIMSISPWIYSYDVSSTSDVVLINFYTDIKNKYFLPKKDIDLKVDNEVLTKEYLNQFTNNFNVKIVGKSDKDYRGIKQTLHAYLNNHNIGKPITLIVSGSDELKDITKKLCEECGYNFKYFINDKDCKDYLNTQKQTFIGII